MKNYKPQVCFVALNCFNLVIQKCDVGHIGGAEVQQWLTANWLKDRGFRISFVTLDHGQPDKLKYEGFTVCKAYKKDSGLPGIRFFWPRWAKLWKALSQADCDIYYQRGAGLETGQVALWCHLNGKKFIHAIAHEPDCTKEVPMLSTLRERVLYRYGLKRADVVIAQTEVQQRLLQQHYGKNSSLVKNCALSVALPNTEDIPVKNTSEKTVLWIGRLAPIKRFEWLLDLAVKMPDFTFVVVGGANNSSDYDTNLQKAASKLSNVKMVGEVQYALMQDYYQRAGVICCTSLREGFPNVFLEAWRAGLPVVSTVDPDGVIEKNNLGYVANDVETLINCLFTLFTDKIKYVECSQNCISYFSENHTPDSTLPVLEECLMNLSTDTKKP